MTLATILCTEQGDKTSISISTEAETQDYAIAFAERMTAWLVRGKAVRVTKPLAAMESIMEGHYRAFTSFTIEDAVTKKGRAA